MKRHLPNSGDEISGKRNHGDSTSSNPNQSGQPNSAEIPSKDINWILESQLARYFNAMHSMHPALPFTSNIHPGTAAAAAAAYYSATMLPQFYLGCRPQQHPPHVFYPTLAFSASVVSPAAAPQAFQRPPPSTIPASGAQYSMRQPAKLSPSKSLEEQKRYLIDDKKASTQTQVERQARISIQAQELQLRVTQAKAFAQTDLSGKPAKSGAHHHPLHFQSPPNSRESFTPVSSPQKEKASLATAVDGTNASEVVNEAPAFFNNLNAVSSNNLTASWAAPASL